MSKSQITLQAVPSNALSADVIGDFAVSISSTHTILLGNVLFFLWIFGILLSLVYFIRSYIQLIELERSSLPLENNKVLNIYNDCLHKCRLDKYIPIYTSAYLTSPVSTGIIHSRIYIPLSLLSEYDQAKLKYILLHEIEHIKYHDSLVNLLMNLIQGIYWFHPVIRYFLKETHCDREIACDSSVLDLLEDSENQEYGNTLLHFAEMNNVSRFLLTTGISGSKVQIFRRIQSIAAYHKRSILSRFKGHIIFSLILLLLLITSPVLSTYANIRDNVDIPMEYEQLDSIDHFFQGYKGSFVLYDESNDTWSIYNDKQACTRISPCSTYKIYGALLGLEQNIITPENSYMKWDNKDYPFNTWKHDQNLKTAMSNSVNWYFQAIDDSLGYSTIHSYLQYISYGNQTIGSDLSTYWGDGSLTISPVEQVELLYKLNHNEFHFSTNNVSTVKASMELSSDSSYCLYGKTGTNLNNGQNVNGWFVGFLEMNDNVYYFATNIQGEQNASGTQAYTITSSILNYILHP